MWIESPATSREAWYDRNPDAQSYYVAATPGAATRALTTDWTHTTAAGEKTLVEHMHALAINKSTTALNEEAAAHVSYQESGGSDNPMLWAYLVTGMTAVSTAPSASPQFTMVAGDAIRGKTKSDNNNAGTNVTVATGVKVTDYGA